MSYYPALYIGLWIFWTAVGLISLWTIRRHVPLAARRLLGEP